MRFNDSVYAIEVRNLYNSVSPVMPSSILDVTIRGVFPFALGIPYQLEPVRPPFPGYRPALARTQLIPYVGIGSSPPLQPRPHFRSLTVAEQSIP
jgi:hypothetical protein